MWLGLIIGLKALAFNSLALKLTGTPDSFRFLPSTFLRRLLISFAELHFAEYAFPLHLFLQGFQRLIDIVIAYDDLNQGSSPFLTKLFAWGDPNQDLNPEGAGYITGNPPCEGLVARGASLETAYFSGN